MSGEAGLLGGQVCDGRRDCNSGEDEQFCPHRYLCNAGMKANHTAITWWCHQLWCRWWCHKHWCTWTLWREDKLLRQERWDELLKGTHIILCRSRHEYISFSVQNTLEVICYCCHWLEQKLFIDFSISIVKMVTHCLFHGHSCMTGQMTAQTRVMNALQQSLKVVLLQQPRWSLTRYSNQWFGSWHHCLYWVK